MLPQNLFKTEKIIKGKKTQTKKATQSFLVHIKFSEETIFQTSLPELFPYKSASLCC